MALLAVTEPFSVPRPDGFLVTFRKGDLVDSTHPVAKSHKHLLKPAEPTVRDWPTSAPVERATAAPGEKRSAKLPPKG